MFNGKEPTRSGLCLFDPAGREWMPADLIAETTIDWAAEWLHYYELWHLCGKWLGPGIGHESIGCMRAEETRALRSMIAHRLEGEEAGTESSPRSPAASPPPRAICCRPARQAAASIAISR